MWTWFLLSLLVWLLFLLSAKQLLSRLICYCCLCDWRTDHRFKWKAHCRCNCGSHTNSDNKNHVHIFPNSHDLYSTNCKNLITDVYLFYRAITRHLQIFYRTRIVISDVFADKNTSFLCLAKCCYALQNVQGAVVASQHQKMRQLSWQPLHLIFISSKVNMRKRKDWALFSIFKPCGADVMREITSI